MSATKHTPGPWNNTSTNGQGRAWVTDANGGCVAVVEHPEDVAPISATPDLLKALKDLLDAVRQNIDGVPPTADTIFAKAGHAAIAAIAKAEGR